MESKGKAPIMDDFPVQENQDVEMEDHQVSKKNQELAQILAWDIFKSHCKKKIREDGHFDVVCNYCDEIYEFKDRGDYEMLEEHMKEDHSQEFAVEASDMKVTEYASSQSSSEVFVYCHAKMVENLVKMIVMHRLPFSFGESSGFGMFCKVIQPAYKNISRRTVKRRIKGMHKKGKNELINMFSSIDGFVTVGCDLWYDCSKIYQYIRITCYWIDNNWKKQQRVIGFTMVDIDTIDNKVKLMKEILEKYKLDSKIFLVSFDDAYSSVASVDELQRICQFNNLGDIRCDCHVFNSCINSCVQNCLKHLQDYIDKIENAVSVFDYDYNVLEEWKRFCKDHNKRPKRFLTAIPTCWHSTFKLLSDTFEYRELLCEFLANNYPQNTINPQNWEFCENLFNVLRIFKQAIYTFSGVYNPNSHLFLVEAINIVGELQKAEQNVFLKDAILIMKKQWLHYYKTIPSVYLIATVFDPNCKLEGLEEYLTAYYELLNLEHDDQVNVQSKVSEIRSLIYHIYSHFYANQGSTSPTHATPLSDELGLGDRMHQQRHQRLRKYKHSSNSELDFYLTTVFEFDGSATGKEFPVLEWWEKRASIFPCLAKMARQVLAVPVSTSTVKEALWDDLMRILSERESFVAPEMLEATICVSDWLKVELKLQEEFPEEDDDYDVLDDEEDAEMKTELQGKNEIEG